MAATETQGVHRVAAFLLSLDGDAAKRVIAHLAPDVVQEVAQAMLELPDDETGRVEELHREMALSAHGPRSVRACSEVQLGGLLTDAIGAERAEEVLESIRERRLLERPFFDVEAAEPFVVGRVLAQESPAVGAVVIAHLAPTFSAAVLQAFESATALEVVRRVATLVPPPYPVLRRIAEHLAGKIAEANAGPPPADETTRLRTIAELLSNSNPEMEKSVLDAIQEDDESMANELREFMFTWEDIGTIDKRSMQKILGAVDTKTLSMALKGASNAVEENVMSNLSSRVRDMVKEERDILGAVPLSDVLASRDEVMRGVRALIEAGEFRPSRGGDELVE